MYVGNVPDLMSNLEARRCLGLNDFLLFPDDLGEDDGEDVRSISSVCFTYSDSDFDNSDPENDNDFKILAKGYGLSLH